MGGAIITDICKLSTLQIRNSVVQALFSVTFALSCTMFELIIFEIVGIMDTRYYNVPAGTYDAQHSGLLSFCIVHGHFTGGSTCI